MNNETASEAGARAGAPDGAQARQGALLAHLEAAGFLRTEPDILQPAAIFLDLSGEDIRGRLYLTSDAAGQELCLRPEYTIPVCRAYLASPAAGQPAAFSYLGPVFRQRAEAAGEFVQAGLESFGRTDREAADAEILTIALEAATAAGSALLDVRIGDAGLVARLLDVLDLPAAWLRRIRRGHMQGRNLDTILSAGTSGNGADHSGVLAALSGADRPGARALVQDLLSIAGISSVGGRSVSEIAERFLEQAALREGEGVSPEQRDVLAKFFAIEGDPDAGSAALRKLAGDAGLDLGEALDSFDARLNFMAARGLDISRLTFATRFGRNLDYYTGFVFEAHDPGRPQTRPIIGGGRYDRLMRMLGASQDIPAIGAAIWAERLFAQAGGAATAGEQA